MLKIADDPTGHHIKLDLCKNIKYYVFLFLYMRNEKNLAFTTVRIIILLAGFIFFKL